MARIAIVDDLVENRELARIRLERAGHQIVGEATTGREAISLAAATEPDVVVLDVMMPEMNGLEALPEIVRASPRSRVVVFSSVPGLTLSEVERLGGHALLAKVDQFQLVDVVERVLAD